MDNSDDLVKFFAKRFGAIKRGYLDARLPRYKLERGHERKMRRQHFMKQAHIAAKSQADMDRADPYIYNRAMNAFIHGTIDPREVPRNRRIAF